MLNQLSHCTLVSYIPLSKNKIDDGARSKAVGAADDDKATLTVGETGPEGRSHRDWWLSSPVSRTSLQGAFKNMM